MDEHVLSELKSNDPDAARVLLRQLISLLEEGKAGLLNSLELRTLLAGRLKEVLDAPSDEVADKLCITRKRSSGDARYGDTRYRFMYWYWEFMSKNTKPTDNEVRAWLERQGVDPSGKAIRNWKKDAREGYHPYMNGARAVRGSLKAMPLSERCKPLEK